MNNPLLTETTYGEEIYSIAPPTTVVLNAKWKETPADEIELLSKILASVKLSLAAVRIVEAKKLDLSEWHERPSRLIGFGVSVSGVNAYEVVTTPQTQLVLADDLRTLMDSEELKKRLWISLKQLFFG